MRPFVIVISAFTRPFAASSLKCCLKIRVRTSYPSEMKLYL